MSGDVASRYRFLLIDDEPVVREGIAQSIDWAAHGFELVGTCCDGRDGMRAIEELRPDVVLSDICMPFVDGLELASFVVERYPGTRTILLTGYDEFEYAQEAIKLKVHDFLLKPVTAEELRATLDALRQEIDTERSRGRVLDRIKAQVGESLPMLRERLLNRLVRSAAPRQELERKLALLELTLPGPWFAALVCDADAADEDDGLGVIAFQNVVVDVAAEHVDAVAFATPNDQMVVLVSGDDDRQAEARALECAEAVSHRVTRALGRTASIGVGTGVPGIEGFPGTYRAARTALDHRLMFGPDRIITVRQVRGETPEPAHSPECALRAGFVAALRTGGSTESESALAGLFDWYRRGGCTVESCFTGMYRLLADTLGALDSLGIDYDSLQQLGGNPFGGLDRLKTLDDMHAWFHSLAGQVSEYLVAQRDSHARAKAVAAQQYIQSHHANPDLSLSRVCRDLAVSKSCLSPLFKAHTGMTFVEYLTAVRMQAAKELLAGTDLRTYQVAERVGFSDAHYFSLTFRKQCGLSPTGYRESRIRR